MIKIRILIIDDEIGICNVVKEGLEKTGNFKVDMAVNGKDGIRAAKDIKPDLILLDIRMSGMDGLEVIERLKADRDTMMIPVVMLTAVEDDATKIKSAQLFNEQYITKPVEIIELRDKIEEVLKRRGVL